MAAMRGVAAAALVLGLAACDIQVGPVAVIQGSGNVRTQSRPVSGFDKVEVSGVGTLTITQASIEALTIQAEANILPELRSDVRDGTLELGPKPGTEVRPTRPIRYDLTVRQLSAITVAGAAQAHAAKLDAGQLTVNIAGASQADLGQLTATDLSVDMAGAGQVMLTGQVSRQTVTISGAGRYLASGLASQQATLTLTGASECQVRVSDHLTATITGAGHVTYAGSPTVDEHVTGAGSITRSG